MEEDEEQALVATEEACRVYVGNLLPKAKESHITSKFARFGTIHSVWIARRPPGFAFVRFASPDSAIRAVNACQEDGAIKIIGKAVRVQMAEDKDKKHSTDTTEQQDDNGCNRANKMHLSSLESVSDTTHKSGDMSRSKTFEDLRKDCSWQFRRESISDRRTKRLRGNCCEKVERRARLRSRSRSSSEFERRSKPRSKRRDPCHTRSRSRSQNCRRHDRERERGNGR